MSDVVNFIESGILEMYVMGNTTPQETAEVHAMTAMYEEVRNEIIAISKALEQYAQSQAIEPDPTVSPFIWATIDYMDRLKNGEAPAFPPTLHSGSKVSDYDEWLNRKDLQLQGELNDIEARIIGYSPQLTTAIVWLKKGSPPETHTNELEKFLIVEGTCDIIIDNKVHQLKPGDVLEIPLHLSHEVKVTSNCPCKIILQRAAA